ncbi:Multimodular transpeptidase-transglycosylase [Aequoribacter fuscus]|jgi:penicillin-binding protein 1A|uniref:Penicillin-binding protein 1A n=2 Tax=Aequoribacter fuscus TaxID=2518989 RepID=F3L0N2_9GAMM|nr:Multimodular transpeptidase-transglycosylase [Aequoribacter fuscus]QHJ89528.1 penicillin-binding protein 1A [Aequoribacter fuscus]
MGACGVVWGLAGLYLYLSPGLPAPETLKEVKLQTPMKVYSSDGQLIAQFGEQKRTPLTFDEIPEPFIQALLAAEDDNFFNHGGIDFMGLARAMSQLVVSGSIVSGGSTLTMQVARNYFLTLDQTFIRKFNEILLAIEIERALSKQEIFELYFNRVFLGHRAYGFEAASEVYYGRSIKELSLSQWALLAGIPKAPSRDNPVSDPQAAKDRRNWILGRMVKLGYITSTEAEAAKQEPVLASLHGGQVELRADYVAELVRAEMLERFGNSAYTDGYVVTTSINGNLQATARRAVINGLQEYDRRHGYRGAEAKLPGDPMINKTEWQEALNQRPSIADMQAAAVIDVNERDINAMLSSGRTVQIAWQNGLQQANPYINEDLFGRSPTKASDVVAVGDVIRIRERINGDFELTQLPAAQAALVSLEAKTGRILSLVGGIGFSKSKFNRATQAKRQPGSSFKPFIYAAALDAGMTAASLVNDAPLVFKDASLEGVWRPENDGGKFYGPTRLRWALTKSRNLVSIRILEKMGVRNMLKYASTLGFSTDEFAPDLSLALGTHAMTPIEIAKAYALLANGGFLIEPFIIERIESATGELLFEANPAQACDPCKTREEVSMADVLAGNIETPQAPRVMDERIHFILDSMLKDVVKLGTGRAALSLKRNDLAGKTGTTNGPRDAWFSGYNPNIVTTTWVGFDDFSELGSREFGGTAALPIWIDFMREALKGQPEIDRQIPPGIVRATIDSETGLLARSGQKNTLEEYFRAELAPKRYADEAQTGSQDLLLDVF